MPHSCTVIFQSAKLGDIPQILAELAHAERLRRDAPAVGRVYGLSGGALVALAFALTLAAQRNPQRWGQAHTALADFAAFLRRAHSRHIRRLNLNPLYGFYNLHPLRRWVAGRLRAYGGADNTRLSELGVPLYLCALNWDGILTLLGPPDDALQCPYHFVRVGPPRDALILDALIAALSTILSTSPALVQTDLARPAEWFRDCRPAIVDAGAIVADLEAADGDPLRDPRPILRTPPYAPIRPWKLNWFTSSFIMHSQGERNQTLLTAHYLDLLARHRALEHASSRLSVAVGPLGGKVHAPVVGHVDLPYIGSTEASTNMRQSVENREALMARFRGLLQGQLDAFPFDQPANVIYGAGGFSGILGGLATTRAVDAGFARGGGDIRQIYGVSAGVLNGFFHAVQLAAASHPDLYTPSARQALNDLDVFIAHVDAGKILCYNRNPVRLWRAFANLGPLEQFLLERLAAYTGSPHAAQITFDDIALPLTVTAARRDGFTEFLGMTTPDRSLHFGERDWRVRPAPVVRAILAGWSMNTYIEPTLLGDEAYQDGGGTFYDPGLLVACLDAELTNLLNIHLDEPEGHSYHLPPRPSLVRIVFDTHNYTFPEERRRMRLLTDLLYRHYRLRARYTALLSQTSPEVADDALHRMAQPLPFDFRRTWTLADPDDVLYRKEMP